MTAKIIPSTNECRPGPMNGVIIAKPEFSVRGIFLLLLSMTVLIGRRKTISILIRSGFSLGETKFSDRSELVTVASYLFFFLFLNNENGYFPPHSLFFLSFSNLFLVSFPLVYVRKEKAPLVSSHSCYMYLPSIDSFPTFYILYLQFLFITFSCPSLHRSSSMSLSVQR